MDQLFDPHFNGAAWIAVLVTFVLGVASLWVGLYGNRKTRFINTVTNQRVLWIEQLRQDIATFVGLAGVMIFDMSGGQLVSGSTDNKRELHRLRRVIILRLNPESTEDQKIEALLPEIQKAALTNDITFPEERLDQLTKLSQTLLKVEWEKVKLEAEAGRLRKRRRAGKKPDPA